MEEERLLVARRSILERLDEMDLFDWIEGGRDGVVRCVEEVWAKGTKVSFQI